MYQIDNISSYNGERSKDNAGNKTITLFKPWLEVGRESHVNPVTTLIVKLYYCSTS